VPGRDHALTSARVVGGPQLLINPTTHPVYLHCMTGAEVTGLIVMCLRKLQLWSQTFGLLEFSRCGHARPTTTLCYARSH
jgi:protein tyrosine/serine phosphatase